MFYVLEALEFSIPIAKQAVLFFLLTSCLTSDPSAIYLARQSPTVEA